MCRIDHCGKMDLGLRTDYEEWHDMEREQQRSIFKSILYLVPLLLPY